MFNLQDIFTEFNSKKYEPSINVKQFERNLSYAKFNTIPIDDTIPVFVIEPDINNGPWIAGGAPLQWYQNKSVKQGDIDVFCRNKKQADDVIKRVLAHSSRGAGSATFQTDNATTIEFGDPIEKMDSWKIQVITCKYFNSIEEVIKSFDITVCQVATCGYEWIVGPQTVKDINQKSLRFNRYTPDSVKRLTKYWCYGYTPVNGTLSEIMNNQPKWDFSNDEEYANII